MGDRATFLQLGQRIASTKGKLADRCPLLDKYMPNKLALQPPKRLIILSTSLKSVSAVLNQYFNAIVGLNSKSEAFADISLMLMGFENCKVDPAMICELCL